MYVANGCKVIVKPYVGFDVKVVSTIPDLPTDEDDSESVSIEIGAGSEEIKPRLDELDKQIAKLMAKVGGGPAQEAGGELQQYAVVVYNLPSYINSDVLEAQFADYGVILSASVSGPKTDNLGNTTKIGYVAFQREEEAKRAITEANNANVYQNKITVVQYKNVQQRIEENADIRVTGLPKSWKVKDVEDYFCR